MVKNEGGKKTRGQARKFVNSDDKKDTKSVRESEDETLEIYSQVEKVCGGGMYNVICLDGKTRLCHSAGKFRGRNKKDNFVSLGTWLLVGLREYESGGNNKKLQNCDLMEVYNDSEKEKLKTTVNKDWSVFLKNDAKNSFTSQDVVNSSENLTFGDAKTMEYQTFMAAELSKPTEKRGIVTVAGGDEIDIDDI
jgi:initiation factor 1A